MRRAQTAAEEAAWGANQDRSENFPSKIFVTGNAGAGKTTLARALGEMLSLPVYGLDQIVWEAGWVKAPPEKRDAALKAWAAQPAWVIEGVSEWAETQADLVVFLDVPPAVCAWRCARRNGRYLFRSRPGLPPRCPELLIIPRLLKIILRFNGSMRPGILKRAHDPQRKSEYRCLRHDDDRARFLAELNRRGGP